ncbi:MAG: protein-export chaperone SecB [Hyphomonadaceae bacterium]
MAEDQSVPAGTQPQNPAPAATGPAIRVVSQYIKDLSFENPGVTNAQAQPNIDLGIDVGATAHAGGPDLYEVSLRMQAKALANENVLFMLELDYAGLFQLQNFNNEDMEAALLIECPRQIFPFARRIISDITRDGGFPPLLVDPIDFRNLYITQKQRQAAAPETPPASA